MPKAPFGCLWCLFVFFLVAPSTQAFVLIGPVNSNETPAFNYTDDLGGPKGIYRGTKRFFRWNLPSFVYSFDASFVNYFGLDGMDAVHEAFTVVNDFFENDEYQGMSQLDLAKHSFALNYNTTWVNTTARNAQVIDLKSLVLGMLVNQLGLGNPHRHAFTITGVQTNSASSTLNFSVRLRNYDPITHKETDWINNVRYSYRLVHDAPGVQVGAAPPVFTVADMEEFTADTTGNSWSSVAAITDAFYGNTSLFWTDTPSLFNFGVYYDGLNAMGGRFQPRHALTYDDAAGLKYLYSKNNIVHESLDLAGGVVMVEPPQYLPQHIQSLLANPSGKRFPFLPRVGGTLNGALPAHFPSTTPFAGTPGLPGVAIAPQINALRGGVDKIQFHYQPFDSLLGTIFTPTNYMWTDTFLWQPTTNNMIGISDAAGKQIGTLLSRVPGIQWNTPNPDLAGARFWRGAVFNYEFKNQKLARNMIAPDMLFVADYLPLSADGVPIGWQRPVNSFTNLAALNVGYAGVASSTTEVGPGVFTLGGGNTPMVYQFTKTLENFEILWSGEASVVGNLVKMQPLWGWIRGPGPHDVITFPKDGNGWRIQNEVIPDTEPPTITMVSDDGGLTPIEEATLVRTEETLTLIGEGLGSVKVIEILSGGVAVQSIINASQYVLSNTRIDIPPGVISDEAEGADREVRAWNTIGPSVNGPQKFGIRTGRPIVTSTWAGKSAFDRSKPLQLQGYGFESKEANQTKLSQIRIDLENGSQIYPLSGNTTAPVNIEVISDTRAVIPPNSISNIADGSNRKLRVSRKKPGRQCHRTGTPS